MKPLVKLELVALPDPDADRDLQVFEAWIGGDKPRALAKRFHLDFSEVMAVIRSGYITSDDDFKRSLMTREIERLEQMLSVLYRRALEGDTGAANSYAKLSERRSRLLGLDLPQRADMVLIEQPSQNSTQRLAAALALARNGSNISDAGGDDENGAAA